MIPRGVTLPGGFGDDESINVATDAWLVEAGLPALRESWPRLEVALAAEIADTEALEPRNLAEAKRRPDWPLWEQAISE